MVKKHNKKVIIGQNDSGWWAVNPDPALVSGDIEKIEILIKEASSRDQLLEILKDLGYQHENIAEGILNL